MVYSKLLCGKNISLKWTANDTVGDIKKKINNETGLHKDDIILLYGGVSLDDDKRTIEDCGINKNSTINVILPLRGGTVLTFRPPDGTPIKIEVVVTDKISDVKKMIKEKIRVEPKSQKLVFEGTELEDDKTCGYYNLVENRIINIIVRNNADIQINVMTLEKELKSILVSPDDRIIDVKKKVDEKFHVPPEQQTLIYTGKNLENDKTVEYYNVLPNANITMVMKVKDEFQIFATTMDGMTMTIEVKKTNKISDVKGMIHKGFALNPDEHGISFRGITLEDDKTIGDYHITPKSVINVVVRLKYDYEKIVSVEE